MTEPRFCAADVGYRWIGPEYREREKVESEECGHPEGRHRYGICYDCDELEFYAGMCHEFVEGGVFRPMPRDTPVQAARRRLSEALCDLAPKVYRDGEPCFTSETALQFDEVHAAIEEVVELKAAELFKRRTQ